VERERGREWRKRIKPFFLGGVGESESATTCVEVLRRRITERAGSFISLGPLSYSFFESREDWRDGAEICGGMGSGTTLYVYVEACKLGSTASANAINDLERWRAVRGAPNREGRREKVADAGGLAGGGEPGSTPATQAEIAVIVLEPRREMVPGVGVGGRGVKVGARGGGGWARKSNGLGLSKVVIRGTIITNL
jgi:hypothetical protein